MAPITSFNFSCISRRREGRLASANAAQYRCIHWDAWIAEDVQRSVRSRNLLVKSHWGRESTGRTRAERMRGVPAREYGAIPACG
jgi:hypothetical protein